MSQTIVVNYATLTAAAGQFRQAAGAIAGALRTLGSGAGGASGAMGPGPAGPAYGSMSSAWQAELQAQETALNDMATRLDAAARAYQHTDQTAVPAGGGHAR